MQANVIENGEIRRYRIILILYSSYVVLNMYNKWHVLYGRQMIPEMAKPNENDTIRMQIG